MTMAGLPVIMPTITIRKPQVTTTRMPPQGITAKSRFMVTITCHLLTNTTNRTTATPPPHRHCRQLKSTTIWDTQMQSRQQRHININNSSNRHTRSSMPTDTSSSSNTKGDTHTGRPTTRDSTRTPNRPADLCPASLCRRRTTTTIKSLNVG